MRGGFSSEKTFWGNDHLFCIPTIAYRFPIFACLSRSAVTYFLSLHVLLPIQLLSDFSFLFLCGLTIHFSKFPSWVGTKCEWQHDFVTHNYIMSFFPHTISLQACSPRSGSLKIALLPQVHTENWGQIHKESLQVSTSVSKHSLSFECKTEGGD